jgi:hypothetical protein
MKPRGLTCSCGRGYCLVELMLVLTLIGFCVGVGCISWLESLSRSEARGCAQSWQAAAAVGQVGVLWRGGRSEVSAGAEGVRVMHEPGCGGLALDGCVSVCPIAVNVSRWRVPDGAKVTFSGQIASPDSGGSLYFGGASGSYRVIVRPETGLTVRSWAYP